jgi:hypothetical protein
MAAAVRYAPVPSSGFTAQAVPPKPSALAFHSVAFSKENPLLAVLALYKEPYILDINHSFTIKPFSEIDGYILLPPIVRIRDTSNRCVFEARSERPKDAWYGDPKEGVAGTSVNTDFFFKAGEIPSNDGLCYIVCPLSAKNDTESEVEFRRLCIPSDGLTLYHGQKCLYTDKVRCSIEANVVHVNTMDGPSLEFGASEVLEEPRQSAEARFFSRSLSLLMKLAGK